MWTATHHHYSRSPKDHFYGRCAPLCSRSVCLCSWVCLCSRPSVCFVSLPGSLCGYFMVVCRLFVANCLFGLFAVLFFSVLVLCLFVAVSYLIFVALCLFGVWTASLFVLLCSFLFLFVVVLHDFFLVVLLGVCLLLVLFCIYLSFYCASSRCTIVFLSFAFRCCCLCVFAVI